MDRKNNKGLVIFLVVGVIAIVVMMVVAMTLVLQFRVKQQEKIFDWSKAKYLCETGLSFMMMDMQVPGRINGYPVTKQYRVNYYSNPVDISVTIDRANSGEYNYTILVPSPSGLGCQYRCGYKAKRGFPVFILGKP